ncbi:MAG: hypothetical protein KF832_24980 [Caldilineaceae bacterium]|nr:hypothetical protein [Caldilineaceae bacterium]
MLLESLLIVGAVAVGFAMLIMLVYYILTADQSQPTETEGPTWNHPPVLDDDLLYLASSMVPYQEYAYFPVLPLSRDRQEVAQSLPQRTSLPVLPFQLERQEAIQTA